MKEFKGRFLKVDNDPESMEFLIKVLKDNAESVHISSNGPLKLQK